VGSAPIFRIHGKLRRLEVDSLSPGDVRRLLFSLLSHSQRESFEIDRELDFALTVTGKHRFRVNAHFQRGTVAVALRLIPNSIPDAATLGLPPVVRELATKPHGLVLVTGPTGAGKSTTLATMIDQVNSSRSCHIITIEDPIEFVHYNRMATVEQREVGPDTRSFAAALKFILRQDPDVIAVGETRDAETARMALEAAMTGHLVLTSMHANDVGSVLQRLESLECGRSLIAEAVSFVVVQRLARRLCPSCVRLDPPPPALLESLVARRLAERGSQVALPRPVGCDLCQQTGYQGRIAVVEWWQVTPEARDALAAGASHNDVLRAAGEARMLQTFRHNAAYLMARKALGTSEALMAVAG